MNDDVEHEHDEAEAASIGVGMGGSCPVCRAPVDLGQEFCLECGSPIRFTPKQRRQQRGGKHPAAPATSDTGALRRGFPWIPFAIVLLLVVGGIAFALVEGGDSTKRTSKGESTQEALPEITNSVPDSTPSSQTTTLQDCIDSQTLDTTQPAVGSDGTNEQIPSITPDAAAPDDGSSGADDAPSSTDTAGTDDATVTVDQNGNPCSGSNSGTDPGATGITTPTTPTTGTSTTPTTTASGDWPAGQTGWTVIVDNKTDRASANSRAGDVQEDGFEAGVLVSGDFVSLCAGYYVVFSGNFDTEAKAKAHVEKLNDEGYFGLYVREIRTTGDAARCEQSRPQN